MGGVSDGLCPSPGRWISVEVVVRGGGGGRGGSSGVVSCELAAVAVVSGETAVPLPLPSSAIWNKELTDRMSSSAQKGSSAGF